MTSQIVRMYLRIRNPKDAYNNQIDDKTLGFNTENFRFQKIFEGENNQEEIFNSLGKPLVENVMKGSNGILIAYGPTGSGKSYSLFGEHSEDGIINKVFEELFLRASLLKGKKTMGIVISYIEIDDDNVIDLVKKIKEGEKTENLEIREYQGHVYMDNLSIIQIDSLQTAENLIHEARKQRRLSMQNNENISVVHTLLKITVSQKENNTSKSGTLTIINLADSDSSKESVAKNLETLKNLLIDLQQGHHASSDESMLTKILTNTLKNNCLTSILFHIINNQEKQTLNTLQYSTNCYLNTAITNSDKILFQSSQQTDRIKMLKNEIKELQHKIDKAQDLHEAKLRNFGDIIGFNLDIDVLVNGPSGSKERKILENHLNSTEALYEIENRNRRLEQKLTKNNKFFEEIHKFKLKSQEKNHSQLKSLENQIKDVKLQIIELNEKIKDGSKSQMTGTTDDLQRILLANHMELEEKAAVIHNLPLILQSVASDMRAVVEYKEMGKAELEYDLLHQYEINEETNNKNILKLISESEKSLGLMNQEIRRFEHDCNHYIQEKFEKIHKVETELIDCYKIIIDQDKLIKDIEAGIFNNGIKPVYMTIHDIPKPPLREKYPKY